MNVISFSLNHGRAPGWSEEPETPSGLAIMPHWRASRVARRAVREVAAAAVVVLCAVVPGLSALGAGAASPPEREYRWESGVDFAYTFEIEAEMGGLIYTVKGSSLYQPQPAASSGAGLGTGTAFVIHRGGYLITCEHVVHKGKRFKVRLDETTVDATVLEVDAEHDLALLQVPLQGLTPLPLGDSNKVDLAQEVRVVGYPMSTVLGTSVKVTTGSIAGKVSRAGKGLFQIDASVNPGNSGGPVVNDRGEVIGVASAKLVGKEVSNVAFAVPSEHIRRLLDKRRISALASPAFKPLSGPELARRVTPSVALVTVLSGSGGLGSGERYRLTFQGQRETWQRPKQSSAEEATLVSRQDALKGRIFVDTHGEVQEVSKVSHLPFGLGPQGLVGIERLPDLNQQSWEARHTASLTDVLANSPVAFPDLVAERGPPIGPMGPPPFRFGIGPRLPHGPTTPTVTVLQQIEYQLGPKAEDGCETFKRLYKTSLPTTDEPRKTWTVSGEGSVRFDRRASVVRSADLLGSLSYEAAGDSFLIPIKYSYRRVDPKALPKPEQAPAAAPKVASLPARRPTTPPPASPLVPAAPAEREPLPNQSDRDQANALVDEVFGEALAAARTAQDKRALIDKLLNAAASEPHGVRRFVLLDRARLLAISIGEVDAAQRAVAEMVHRFQIDSRRARVAVLLALDDNVAGPQFRPLADFGAVLLEEIIAADEFQLADQVHAVALQAARKAGHGELVKRLQQRETDLQRLGPAFEVIGEQRALLEQNADDAPANLVVGRYYCFDKADWTRGLPLLARGSDPDLKSAAEKDLAAPADAKDQVALGDRWWNLANTHEGEVQQSLRARALRWYRQATPQLAGLESARIEKRLLQYRDLLPREAPPSLPTARVATAVPPQPSSVTIHPRAPRTAVGAAESQASSTAKAAGSRVSGGGANAITDTKIAGGGRLEPEFRDLAPEGALLIGFEVGLGKFIDHDVISALRPIYRLRDGSEVLGQLQGSDMSRAVRVQAKPGYAVGGMKIKSALQIDGFSLTFMRVNYRALDHRSKYDSEWIGGPGGSREAVLGGDGAFVVGIIGRASDKRCSALGLCQKR